MKYRKNTIPIGFQTNIYKNIYRSLSRTIFLRQSLYFVENSKQLKDKKNQSTSTNDMLVLKHICNFIAEKWINGRLDSNGRPVSKAKYADECDLAKSTITKIASSEGYNLPFQTIVKICKKEEMPLSQFFSEFEKTYKIKY